MYLGQDCHRRNHRPGGQYKNLKDKQPDKGQWVGKGESEPPKRDKEEVWMGETISFAEEIRNKMVSVRRVQGRETREIAVFWLQDWVCFQSSLPFPGTRRWGWGASRLVVTWACIFLPPPVPGIPENSFRLNPKRAPFGFRTMPGNTEGRGPRLAPEGSGLLGNNSGPSCPRVPQVPGPNSARALLSTHCFRIPPPGLSPRISAPHPTAPSRLPRLLRRAVPARGQVPISLLQAWGAAGRWGRAGVNCTSPATHRPRARAHPAAAFSNLSASVSSMMRLFTSSRIMAAAAPGRGRRNKGR